MAYAGGGQARLSELILFFHPTDETWLVYDAAARDALHDGGALTPEAREFRFQQAKQLPQVIDGREVVDHYLGFSHSVKLSDDLDYSPGVVAEDGR